MLFIDYLTQFIEILRFLSNTVMKFVWVFNIDKLGSGVFGHFSMYFRLKIIHFRLIIMYFRLFLLLTNGQ